MSYFVFASNNFVVMSRLKYDDTIDTIEIFLQALHSNSLHFIHGEIWLFQ